MEYGPGSRVDGYELVRPLGAGGMGEVWLASEVRLGRKVALKLLPAALTEDAGPVERFEQEARAASALSHPNVCTILALGQTVGGQHYIAMEYVEGNTLRQQLAVSWLTLRQTLDVVTQVAAALSAAHDAGIVHRDIRGEAIDARTDVFSLGVLLYELLAREHPFSSGSTGGTISAILTREPPPVDPGTVPPELQRILRKCLEKERSRRYQTMRDVLIDLENVARDLALGGNPSSGSMPAPAGAPRRSAEGRATLVLELPSGQMLPSLSTAPPDGTAQWDKIPGARTLGTGDIEPWPGPDPSTYLFTKREELANLFRLGLP